MYIIKCRGDSQFMRIVELFSSLQNESDKKLHGRIDYSDRSELRRASDLYKRQKTEIIDLQRQKVSKSFLGNAKSNRRLMCPITREVHNSAKCLNRSNPVRSKVTFTLSRHYHEQSISDLLFYSPKSKSHFKIISCIGDGTRAHDGSNTISAYENTTVRDIKQLITWNHELYLRTQIDLNTRSVNNVPIIELYLADVHNEKMWRIDKDTANLKQLSEWYRKSIFPASTDVNVLTIDIPTSSNGLNFLDKPCVNNNETGSGHSKECVNNPPLRVVYRTKGGCSQFCTDEITTSTHL